MKLTTTNFLSVATMLTSLACIWLANGLGRRVTRMKNKHQRLEERYNAYYLPVIKRLYQINPKVLNKEHLYTILNIQQSDATHNNDFIRDLIHDQMQFVSPELAKLYSLYWEASYSAVNFYFPHNNQIATDFFGEKQAIMADEILFKIIKQTLKESQQIERELELPDIAEPLVYNLNLNSQKSKQSTAPKREQ